MKRSFKLAELRLYFSCLAFLFDLEFFTLNILFDNMYKATLNNFAEFCFRLHLSS